MKEFFEILYLIFIFVVICILGYLTARFLSVKSIGMSQSKYMKIIDRIPISKDKFICIVKMGDNCYIIGVSGTSISMLTSLKEEELVLNSPSEYPAQTQLLKCLKRFKFGGFKKELNKTDGERFDFGSSFKQALKREEDNGKEE